MSEQRKYDEEYKKEAVKLANKIGNGQTAEKHIGKQPTAIYLLCH